MVVTSDSLIYYKEPSSLSYCSSFINFTPSDCRVDKLAKVTSLMKYPRYQLLEAVMDDLN